MNRIAAFLPAARKLRFVNAGNGRLVSSTLKFKKLPENECSEKKEVSKAESDPMVTYSKPPPIPPVLGPILVFTLLCDSEDD